MDEVTKALLVRQITDALTAEFSRQIKTLQDTNDSIQGQLRVALAELGRLTTNETA